MARQVKSKWLGARVDAELEAKVAIYTETTDTTMGDLLRKAIKEYLDNHPIKTPRVDRTKPTKPGE